MMIENIIDNGHVSNLPHREQKRLHKAKAKHARRPKGEVIKPPASPREVSSRMRKQKRAEYQWNIGLLFEGGKS